MASATAPVQGGTDGIDVKVWANREVIRSGDSFEFWLLVKNSSSQPITDLKVLRLDSNGFERVGSCWMDDVPGCRPGASPSGQPDGLETNLKPGETGMVFAVLKCSRPAPKSLFAELSFPNVTFTPIKADVSWKVAGKFQKQPSPITISLGVAPHASHWLVVLYSVLKDFLLPVLLGILAYVFQYVLQDRARAQAARNALLPIATANAAKYLLPVIAAVRALERVAKEVPPPLEQGFFYFTWLFKHMRDQSGGGGGLFLGDLESEKLVSQCWVEVFGRSLTLFGYIDLSHTMDLMEGNTTISLFLGQLEGPGRSLTMAQLAASRVKEKFRDWSSQGDDLRILMIMADVLGIEVNRLYLGWYDHVERPNAKQLIKWEDGIREFPGPQEELLKKLGKYSASLPRRTKLRKFFLNLRKKWAPQPRRPSQNP